MVRSDWQRNYNWAQKAVFIHRLLTHKTRQELVTARHPVSDKTLTTYIDTYVKMSVDSVS